jgi:general secretion pathway protein D
MPRVQAPLPVSDDGTIPPPPGPPVLEVQFPISGQDPVEPNVPSAFSINKQAGLVSVFSSARQHKKVHQYMTKLRRISTAQVLIEAKILEVALTDEFASGIEWNKVGGLNLTGLARASITAPRPVLDPDSLGNVFSLTLEPTSNIDAVVSAISRFGTVRALSSPRITVLNNQSAMLSVVENKTFFELKVKTQTDAVTGNRTVDVNSKVRSVPEGIMVTVMPAINLDAGEISLALRPTITRITGSVDDPSIALALLSADPANAAILNDVKSTVPQLAVQEIDSIIKMQTGQVMVMGGLMQDRNDSEEVGIPVLSEVPLLGNLFKSHKDKTTKSELVIFIKATIVPGNTVNDTDKDLYNTFGHDRRPVRM